MTSPSTPGRAIQTLLFAAVMLAAVMSGAWATEAGASLSHSPALVMTGYKADVLPLQMTPRVSPINFVAVAESDRAARMETLQLSQTVGIAAIMSVAVGLGAVTGTTSYVLAAGAAVLVVYLLLP